ncbi:MAG: hypothetical protein L0Z48_08680 [candidate division Zixibacteria bacterium]|nr:hypothetical protein [candidate division Zixibacteria bacterium]
MKRFILACVILLAPAVTALGQETAPADTGAVQIPGQPGVATDTGTTSIPPQEQAPTDTGAPAPADTTPAVVPPIQETVPPIDTAAVPSDTTTKLADTTAIPPSPAPPPREAEPVPVIPQPESTLEEEGEEAGAPKPPNRLALGLVFNDDAPVAMRAWFNPKVGLDVGLGINLRQVQDQRITPQNPESTTAFLDLSFDLGLPVRVLRHDRVDLIVRPGFGFRTRPGFEFSIEDPSVRSVETSLELEISGTIGFEYYPFPKASFGLFTGVALIQNRPGGAGSTTLRVESLPKKAVNVAFRYYVF